jgi:hypothetical protein
MFYLILHEDWGGGGGGVQIFIDLEGDQSWKGKYFQLIQKRKKLKVRKNVHPFQGVG